MKPRLIVQQFPSARAQEWWTVQPAIACCDPQISFSLPPTVQSWFMLTTHAVERDSEVDDATFARNQLYMLRWRVCEPWVYTQGLRSVGYSRAGAQKASGGDRRFFLPSRGRRRTKSICSATISHTALCGSILYQKRNSGENDCNYCNYLALHS